jgi:membrane protease YdiL (CAAX protease family)
MMQKEWFLSERGVWVTAAVLTLIALLENSLLPWSPFYMVYALLTLALPLWLGSYRFGPIRAVKWWHWPAGIVAAILFQLVGAIIFAGLVPLLFGEVLGNPFYDIAAALPAMWETAAARLNSSPTAIQSAYLLFIFVWAGVGEELFYRGYVQGALRSLRGFRVAMLVSAVFFAARHAVQLALLWPDYPWVAAMAWVLFAFIFGVGMSYLYERTKSLYLPVFIHILFNAIPLLAG